MRYINLLKPPPPVTKDVLMRIKPTLIAIGKKHNLKLLIIFGSLAKDNMRPLSDIDVAFLKDKKVSLEEKLSLMGDLQTAFGREDVDLAELYNANPLLRMCVLRNGLFVYSRSAKDVVRFRYRTIVDFLATNYLRSQFSHYLRQAVLGG